MNGAPSSITVEKIAARASASRKAWKTRASARSRCPAPNARETADETPTPMPLLVVCRTSITQGNASEAPASALVPMRPRKNPSNVITPAKASRVRTLGAARRSSVGRIAPSSRSLVRAAVDGATLLAGAKEGEEIETLRSLTGRSLSPGGDERSAWTKRLFPKPGGVGSRAAGRKPAGPEIWALSGASANDNFLAQP